ncbi:MAG: DUF6524 family protein [Pseudomonadota bacterium]
MGFLIRWAVAFMLLAVIYNPTGLSYADWAAGNWETQTSLVVLVGLILLVAMIVFVTAVLRGIGGLGAGLVLAVVAALIWVAYDFDLLDLQDPTGLSYAEWAAGNWETQTSLVVLVGLILLVAVIVFVTAVLRGIGGLGAGLVLAVVAALIWVAYDFDLLDLQDPTAMTWVGLLAVSLVLAVGMYWGILWRRISGQLEVDDETQ